MLDKKALKETDYNSFIRISRYHYIPIIDSSALKMDDLKVTTSMLWKGAFLFASIDIPFIYLLHRMIKPVVFRKMKWALFVVTGIFFCLLFGTIVSFVFWDSVYAYVFPLSFRWLIPPFIGILFASYAIFAFFFSFRLPGSAIINYIFSGGLWGIITHILAIYRGILEKPPILQGVRPVAAITIAALEFIFYWCLCIIVTSFVYGIREKIRNFFKHHP